MTTTALERREGQPAPVVLAARLREARDWRIVTQRDLSTEVTREGVRLNRSQVAKIELATRPTSVPELLAIAAVLDVPPPFLLTPIEGEQLRVHDKLTLTAEATWAWFVGGTLRGGEPLLPEAEQRRREEDETLAKADEIRARRALEGGQA